MRAPRARRIYEKNVEVATLYELGSSKHERDMEDLRVRVREAAPTNSARIAAAEAFKQSIIRKLEGAADAIVTFAARDSDDALLEVDPEAAALEALQLRRAADALRRQSVADIRTTLLAGDGAGGRGRRSAAGVGGGAGAAAAAAADATDP